MHSDRMCFKMSSLICRFVGRHQPRPEDPNDSGFSEGLEVPAPIVAELANGYEQLYLCKPGDLVSTFKSGLPPPRFTSVDRRVEALKVTVDFEREAEFQLSKMEAYRLRGPALPPVVNID